MEPSQSLRSCRVCLRPQADPAMVRRSAWFWSARLTSDQNLDQVLNLLANVEHITLLAMVSISGYSRFQKVSISAGRSSVNQEASEATM